MNKHNRYYQKGSQYPAQEEDDFDDIVQPEPQVEDIVGQPESPVDVITRNRS